MLNEFPRDRKLYFGRRVMKDNQYFRKFPLVSYRGNPSINILRRVDFNNSIKSQISNFYQYDINSYDRIEDIAFNYYKDVDLDWLLYHVNDIIDPYYGVVLDDDVFKKHISNKYGSIEKAQNTVFNYRVNWRGDDTVLDTAGYNALPGSKKKYWDPVVGQIGIMGYQRKESDLYATTNIIESLTFSTEIDTPFEDGDIIYIPSDALNTSATVSACNTSSITIKDITGTFDKVSNYNIASKYTDTTATIDYTSYTLLQEVIPALERVYYSKYTAYDYEVEINEQKRTISLVDSSYSESLNKQLKELMK